MNELLIACEMLKDELDLAMRHTNYDRPVVWLEKGLHETPDLLREKLQDVIEQEDENYDLILLAFCWCGGAVDGLKSRHATLVVPRFDDCIRILLSSAHGLRNEADAHSLYLTGQWLRSSRYILQDYGGYIEKYGEKKAKKILHAMLANYRNYCMIDTGAYDLEAFRQQATDDAAVLGLSYAETPGFLRVYEKLLRHDFDEEFCIAKPGETFSLEQFIAVHPSATSGVESSSL